MPVTDAAIERPILHKLADKKIDLMQACQLLSDTLKVDVYLLGQQGELLGYSLRVPSACTRFLRNTAYVQGRMERLRPSRHAKVKPSVISVHLAGKICVCPHREKKCSCRYSDVVIVPIILQHHALGTLLLMKTERPVTDQDLLIIEQCASRMADCLAWQYMGEIRQLVRYLSRPEKRAAKKIISASFGHGCADTREIARETGVTPSVVLSSVRKLQNARLVEYRLVKNGIRITIANPFLIEMMQSML